MLRVTKDRKPKYVSLGISVNPAHWDFSKNQPKTECPNREYIEMLIADKIKEYSAKIIELKATNQEFISTSLMEKVSVKHTNHKNGGRCLPRVHDFSYKVYTDVNLLFFYLICGLTTSDLVQAFIVKNK